MIFGSILFSVVDPDPYMFLGLLDPDPDLDPAPDPDPSITKQKCKKNLDSTIVATSLTFFL